MTIDTPQWRPPVLALHNIKHDGFFVKLCFASNAPQRPVAAICGFYHGDTDKLKERQQRPFQLPMRPIWAGGGQGTVTPRGALRPCRKVPHENCVRFLGGTSR